jgi:hypothetical protein
MSLLRLQQNELALDWNSCAEISQLPKYSLLGGIDTGCNLDRSVYRHVKRM